MPKYGKYLGDLKDEREDGDYNIESNIDEKSAAAALEIAREFVKMTKNYLKKAREENGFTLVEMMLVVIIISILVAMVVPRLAGRSDQAREAAARTDIEANISAALDLYEMDTGSYPTTDLGLDALRVKPADSEATARWKGPYLKKKPNDPWGNPYVYQYPGTHGLDYDLYSYGKDGREGGDDIGNWEKEETQN